VEIFKMIGLVCQKRATVLIQGDTGTGKELIARIIHSNSTIGEEPFVTLDCSAVVETLLESELFGHEKGAFTGAHHTKPGRIELAREGTLFLDEVGELPLSVQGKFLGFLQRREYMRVGGHQTLQSRCRILAATNRDLATMVKQGQFKEDLYFRLKVVTIHVPPLAERVSDIPYLVNHFLKKINLELGTEVAKVQKGVIDRLMAHHWSGNVRELENVLVQAVVQARSKVVLLEEIEEILGNKDSVLPPAVSPHSLPRVEKEHIRNTLHEVEWNRTRAAGILGISLPTLRSKIRKYGIIPPSPPQA
jgi:two-component system, NtrC family, response regulator AtoC